MTDTILVSVDGGTVGAAAVLRYPHGFGVEEIRRSIIGIVEWGRRDGDTLETGSLAGSCAAMREVEKLLGDAERVFVRCESVWMARGKGQNPKSMLGPAMSLGCFLPLARPIGFYELVQPDKWRKDLGWTWPRGQVHRDQAKERAEAMGRQILGPGVNTSEHGFEALCMGLVPPPEEVGGQRVMVLAAKQKRRATARRRAPQ